MKTTLPGVLCAATLGLGLAQAYSVNASESSLPDEPQAQSATTQSVQADVESQLSDRLDERRKEILADARTAIEATETAVRALDEDDPKAALEALERATGKLELILVRDPTLSLAPVDINIATYDLLASPNTVKAIIHDAENYLEDGEIQLARPLVAGLASEIVISSTSIPLATYPAAIKAITPLIDEGKLDEARDALHAALNTLVVTKEEVIPLPVLRARQLLENAESLAENSERNEQDNESLSDMLSAARKQLKMAELLGYGTKKSFKPMYEQLDMVEDKAASGKSGTGWFDKLKQQLADLF